MKEIIFVQWTFYMRSESFNFFTSFHTSQMYIFITMSPTALSFCKILVLFVSCWSWKTLFSVAFSQDSFVVYMFMLVSWEGSCSGRNAMYKSRKNELLKLLYSWHRSLIDRRNTISFDQQQFSKALEGRHN